MLSYHHMHKFRLLILTGIFLLALCVRFLFFPDNVYFGYDQARDSYASLEILQGHLKLIGPPSSVDERIFHGPLIYYIYAPIYFLFHLNPEAVSFIFRVINAAGVWLVFAITTTLFNSSIGLVAAFIFAVSYEQSQYALFLSHPALAVFSVLFYYFGLSVAIFKGKKWGLILAMIGLGISIQFHYVNTFLILGLIILLILFRKSLLLKNKKTVLIALGIFLLTILSFIIAELRFHFRTTQALFETMIKILAHASKESSSFSISLLIERMVKDNFLINQNLGILLLIVLGFSYLFLFVKKVNRFQLIFLGIWFMNGLIAYFLSGSPSYYYNPGTSVSLIILVSFLIFQIEKKSRVISIILILAIFLNNWQLISTLNKNGPNSDFVIQPQMLTSNEKRVIDYCYQKSRNQPFTLNALTSPLYVNTTWSYLFEWYGKQTYHYLPVWGGRLASGFYNRFTIESKRSNLPFSQCLIVEPTNGIPVNEVDNFFREESYFSKIEDQQIFGTLMVQFRRKI